MPTSEAAIEGIGANGLRWKGEIKGITDALKAIQSASEDGRYDDMDKNMRVIGNKVQEYMGAHETVVSMNDTMAVEFFIDETVESWLHNGPMAEFVAEFDHNLSTIYDWADYNRIILL